ncbi:MAG: DMT family transporter [Alphaproteobacteria bacterium]|nr:MAG: DMT family transporter [Alphaproteobacteria bacterium]
MIRRLASALYANAYLLLSLTALFWAGNFVIGRGVHEHVPPIALATARWILASLIILPFALPHLRRDWPVIRANIPILLFLGTVGVGAFNTLSYSGLNYTTALNALVLQSSGPILIVLASFAIFGDRISLRQAAGIAISLSGVLWMVARGDLAMLQGFRLNAGDALIILALALWGLYTAFLRKRPAIHWLSFCAATFLIGAGANLPFFAWEHVSGRQLSGDLQTFAAIAYVSIFPSVLAYICYNRAVELIGAARAGVCLHLVPLFGSVMAILFLGEEPRLYHLLGIALILTGVALAARKA